MLAIHDVMTLRPVTLRAKATLGQVLEEFDRHDFNAFPVAGEDGAVLVGIVTKLDALRALRLRAEAGLAQSLTATLVEDMMRRGVVAVEPDDPVFVAADLMVETRLRSLPVVRRPRGSPPELVGIVSQGDLLRGLRFAVADTRLPTRHRKGARLEV